MTDHPSKLQNIQLPAKSTNSLTTGVVEPERPNTRTSGDGEGGNTQTISREH